MNPQFGKTLILVGILIVLAGIAVKLNLLTWFGRLPGDIRVENENMRFYFPLVSCLVISGLISLISWMVRRFY